ncbi:DUF4359 domain-containing protein [Candidatus Synechococcus calcipolaris G9]|uniref:DUF4359 domain-containing protein n=1 Tax=Candidatus Synechococcus calcipolaris G9 TaxID=1497997 RepID=A0ABT6F1J5_9SYNE|nr:DUF4359 domain-containing protein [Candidatus Synechococcus calcipolaris]MDG2991697.1 DUF4359 domain-containing protein [Candidatus Synechococcus calcipolaris G9]
MNPKRLTLILAGIGMIGVGLVAGLTNPTLEHYQSTASEEIASLLIREVCPGLHKNPTAIASFLQEGCQALSQGNTREIEDYIAYNTRHYNLGVASLFVTELPVQSIWTLGLFGQFLVLNALGPR